jgi:hypothetical protein
MAALVRLDQPRLSFVFWEEDMGDLTLREALASDRLDDWVREQEDDGAELANGSELERGLALLITQRLAAQGRHQARVGDDRYKN